MTDLTYAQTFLSEDFSSGQMPPNGWTIDNVAAQWTANNTAIAGGTVPEARFQWIQQINTSKLISPQIDLASSSTVILQFNHMYDDYDGEGPAVGVATRFGNDQWLTVWEILPTANVGPEKIELVIPVNYIGQPDFQICFYVSGNLFNLDYWYVDDILLYRPMELNITLLLEGPYTDGQMTNNLNTSGYLPLSQPYNIPPWYYLGEENISSIPNNNITDWVLVELLQKHQSIEDKFRYVSKQAGFVLIDGTITDLNGNSNMSFHIPDTDSLYVWVHQRNHLSAMSSSTLSQNKGIYSYDFTTDSSTAYHGKLAMKELAGGKWGVLAGDGNADGQINNIDKNEIWLQQQNNTDYYSGDFNMDGDVNDEDTEDLWDINCGKGHWVPDTAAIPFVCGDELLDTRDGQQYSTVQIGEQCWMEENLNYETGTSWCYYNSSSYCDVFGRLYNWETIMNGSPGSNSVPSGVKGICPDGWHLPSDGEWCIITQFIDSTVDCGATGYNGTDAGIKMKSTYGWSTGGNGTNESGFNALPGGSMGIYHFDDLYLFAYFWSTTEDYPGYAWLIKLNYGLPTIGRYFSDKSRGYSVRCIKDE